MFEGNLNLMDFSIATAAAAAAAAAAKKPVRRGAKPQPGENLTENLQ